MSSIRTALYNTVSSVSSYWQNTIEDSNLIKNKDILKIGNILSGIFIDPKTIEIPRLVVVGTQSSGKSSVLNSILGVDILPTGTNMVTRSPLQLELIQSSSESCAIFGNYKHGIWEDEDIIKIEYPNISDIQQQKISKKIETITIKNAGKGMNITSKPIFLRIKNPNIPNLSFIDLPGLTMVACTDKGQPKDIKTQIMKLVGSYIQNKKTIILSVMVARSDIETDIALDLIKHYDPNGDRTIGILTKLDLMNDDTDVTNLLEDNISNDLKLKYGYYGVKNRSKKEAIDKNVQEGLLIEQDYFRNHPVYSNIKYRMQLGIPNLCKHLSNILITEIKRSLPNILTKITKNINDNHLALKKLGLPLPTNLQSKTTFIHHILSKFTKKYSQIIQGRGNNINTGRNIKNIFIQYRINISKVDPFSKSNCSNNFLKQSLANAKGNHMSFPIPTVEVLEQIITSEKLTAIQQLFPESKLCTEKVMNELIILTNILIDDIGIMRFPYLTKILKDEIIDKIIVNNYHICLNKINELLEMEQNYLWTDDLNFNNILANKTNFTKDPEIDLMRDLLIQYFKTIIKTVQDILPKCIMLFIVKKTIDSLSSNLFDIVKDEKIDELLKEYDDIHVQRVELETYNTELLNAKKSIEKII